jgi:hypothetical protein
LLRDHKGPVRQTAAGVLVLLGQGFRLFFRPRWLRRPKLIAHTLGELGGD